MKKNDLIDKYTYRVEWSEEDQSHIAKCLEFPSLTAHGTTVIKAFDEIQKVVKESIKWMQEEGEEIPQPLGLKRFKGILTLRVSSEKHRELAIRSTEEGISINQYILSKIT